MIEVVCRRRTRNINFEKTFIFKSALSGRKEFGKDEKNVFGGFNARNGRFHF